MGAHHSRLADPKAPRATSARSSGSGGRGSGATSPAPAPAPLAGGPKAGGGAPHPVTGDVGDDERHGGALEGERG
eukprot:6067239-Prymnesium_polylepis.1